VYTLLAFEAIIISHGNIFNPRHCQRFDQSHCGAPADAWLQIGRAKVGHPFWRFQNTGQASLVPAVSKQIDPHGAC
jgi:hypothetical protein